MNHKYLKTGLAVLFLSIALFLGGQVHGQEGRSYYYHLLEVDIQIFEDSTFQVREKQTYHLQGDFGFFYREIALKDLDHISDIKVFDGEGREISKDHYEVSYQPDKVMVRWDFPRRVFNNELKSWIVQYKVYGGLGFYDQWDELYWNAVFAEREVKVRQAEVRVHLPKEVNKNDLTSKLLVGRKGDEKQSNNYQVVDRKTVRFWSYNLRPGKYITVVVGWPKGIVKEPSVYRNQVINWLVVIVAVGLPLFVFIRMYLLWKEKGKDPEIDKTIMAEYEPPEELPPAVFGVLIDQNIENRDVSATLIDLAVRGYLRIIEEVQEFAFVKNKKYTLKRLKAGGDLRLFERRLMSALFRGQKEVSLSRVKKTFYRQLPDIKEALYKEVEKTGYFRGNIQDTREKYRKRSVKFVIVTLLLIFLFWQINMMLQSVFATFTVQLWILMMSVGISGAIALIFSHYMPAPTAKGLEAKWKLLGFKEYLQKAEKLRMERETVETFSQYLPYAVALGVEEKWAQRFSEVSFHEQDWYVSVGPGGKSTGKMTGMSLSSFSSNLNSFTSSLSRSYSRGSSGATGGSAGGGGGGGGGGAG